MKKPTKSNFILIVMLVTLFHLNSVAQIRVNSSGFVGINSNTPTNNLEVNGTTDLTGHVTINIDPTFSATLDVSGNIVFRGYNSLHLDNSPTSSPHMYPSEDGQFYFGNSSKKAAEIWGYYIHCTTLYQSSDDRIKTDKTDIVKPMQIVNKLSGKKYKFNSTYLARIPESEKKEYEKSQYGFIAQDMLKVLPELVSLDSSSGMYSVNYTGVIPILVEAVKELKSNIDALNIALKNCSEKSSIGNAQKYNPQLKSKGMEAESHNTRSTEDPAQIDASRSLLMQNYPNPFSEDTEIRYHLAEGISKAKIIIYNLSGTQLKSYDVQGIGWNSLRVRGNELAPGSYLYTLLVDNSEVETHKMIILD